MLLRTLGFVYLLDKQCNLLRLRVSCDWLAYRIAGIFGGVIFLWFLWSRGEPRNIYPRKTASQNKSHGCTACSTACMLTKWVWFFPQSGQIMTFTKIIPLQKYPLYGMFKLMCSNTAYIATVHSVYEFLCSKVVE